MRVAITRRQRSLLLFLSASGYVAWFAGVGSRLDAQGIVGSRVASITLSPPPAIPRVPDAIRRDPFSGAPIHRSDRVRSSSGAPTGANSQISNTSDGGVPNIATGVGDAPAPPGVASAPTTLTVRATIVGSTSVAYVANGSAMDIVRVGDSLGERRIAKIDLEGITFDDGSRLDLVSGYKATATPIGPKVKSVTIPIEQLRKLFAHTNTDAAAIKTAQPAVVQTALPPATPSPIRTVDSAGLAPGTNPTPDARDATAYPYPYPYPAAPHR